LLGKKAYLATIRDRVSCDADGEREYDAYRGSAMLLDACRVVFRKCADRYGVDEVTAGAYLLNAINDPDGMAKAKATTGWKRPAVIRRLIE